MAGRFWDVPQTFAFPANMKVTLGGSRLWLQGSDASIYNNGWRVRMVWWCRIRSNFLHVLTSQVVAKEIAEAYNLQLALEEASCIRDHDRKDLHWQHSRFTDAGDC